MKTTYDVVIVGAGFAGLECALHLANSGLDILLLERGSAPGLKPCAQGITPEDLKFIPEGFLNYEMAPIGVRHHGLEFNIQNRGWMISSIDKAAVLLEKASSVCKSGNVQLFFNCPAAEISSNRSLRLESGEEIVFDFLVGADGANSVVRRFLGIPREKILMAFHYLIPSVAPGFEFVLDEALFGNGYAWVFPNSSFTSIGCCSSISSVHPRQLRRNFLTWLDQVGCFDVSRCRLSSGLINFDYRGYRFDNIFLAGDAAGLPSGTTGKGIYPACISGKQIARDILGLRDQNNLIEEWLVKKQRHDQLGTLANHPLVTQHLMEQSHNEGLKR